MAIFFHYPGFVDAHVLPKLFSWIASNIRALTSICRKKKILKNKNKTKNSLAPC
jgi:hypothetical protein